MTQRKGIILGGMRDMLVFGTPQDTPRFQQLLDDASQWGAEPVDRTEWAMNWGHP